VRWSLLLQDLRSAGLVVLRQLHPEENGCASKAAGQLSQAFRPKSVATEMHGCFPVSRTDRQDRRRPEPDAERFRRPFATAKFLPSLRSKRDDFVLTRRQPPMVSETHQNINQSRWRVSQMIADVRYPCIFRFASRPFVSGHSAMPRGLQKKPLYVFLAGFWHVSSAVPQKIFSASIRYANLAAKTICRPLIHPISLNNCPCA